jgi:AAHS family 4-hydroxybenzoate transporter-like MFS transporter
MQARMDVVGFFDAIPMTLFQKVVVILCAIIAMLDGFDTQAIAFVAPAIAEDWGVPKNEFGPVFSAALVGLAVGAFVLGAIADRFGRRRVIIGSTLAFGVFSIATAFAENINQIMLLRFLTGLGLGGAMPNIIALTTEYSPKRLRTVMVVIMFSGFPLGALLGGIVSAQLISIYGWSSVFILGGVLPILLTPILLVKLPESLPFLVRRDRPGDREVLASLVRRIQPAADVSPQTDFYIPEQSAERGSVKHLFINHRALATLMLWGIFFTNLLMFYFLISWLPTVLVEAGLPIKLAILAAVLLNAGSVFGGVSLGHLVDKRGPYKVLTVNYLLAAVFSVLIGASADQLYVVGALVFCAGFCVGGGQLVANSLAATFYPTEIRSTGVGWAIGFGRMGAILGPVIGGGLMTLMFTTQQLFIAVAVPGLVASLAVFLMGRASRDQGALGGDESASSA